MTEETPEHPRRRRQSPDGEPWDGGQWVDVGYDNRWRPSVAERSRALMVLGILGGALLLAAAVASVDDGDGATDAATASASSTSATAPPTTPPTTPPPDPASLDGEEPPGTCADDDRGALPLRDRSSSTVLVLNGSYRSGHADDTTDELEEMGYSSMQPANAADVLDESTIEYLPGFCAEAVRLFLDLGIPTASVAPFDRSDDDVFLGRAEVVLTLGRDST